MRRGLPATGLLICAILLLTVIEAALVGCLFDKPPKQHSDALLAARQEAYRNPTYDNYAKVGERLYQEAKRPAWKDPVSVQYYCEIVFLLGVNLFIITRLLVRLGLPRDPIVFRGAKPRKTTNQTG